MNTYKILKCVVTGQVYNNSIQRLFDNAFVPYDPANVDYQAFKTQINDGSAQIEDADGNVMSPEAAKAYVATLP
jgi:hypothetical protein